MISRIKVKTVCASSLAVKCENKFRGVKIHEDSKGTKLEMGLSLVLQTTM